MNKLISSIFILLLFSNSVSAQKILYPTKGEIVFTTNNIIKDQKVFDALMKKKQGELLDGITDAMRTQSDSVKVNHTKSKPNVAQQSVKDIFEFHHIYDDSLIHSFIYQDSTLFENNDIIINIKKATFTSSSNFTTPQKFVYAKDKNVSIKEFRKERRIINGYDCFKVIYKYKINTGDEKEDLAIDSILGTNEFNITEYWVTEGIRSMYHPICKEKEILKKYYPLEINMQIALFKGMITSNKIQKITLSN